LLVELSSFHLSFEFNNRDCVVQRIFVSLDHTWISIALRAWIHMLRIPRPNSKPENFVPNLRGRFPNLDDRGVSMASLGWRLELR
jgi:hypothetical protein